MGKRKHRNRQRQRPTVKGEDTTLNEATQDREARERQRQYLEETTGLKTEAEQVIYLNELAKRPPQGLTPQEAKAKAEGEAKRRAKSRKAFKTVIPPKLGDKMGIIAEMLKKQRNKDRNDIKAVLARYKAYYTEANRENREEERAKRRAEAEATADLLAEAEQEATQEAEQGEAVFNEQEAEAIDEAAGEILEQELTPHRAGKKRLYVL